MKILKATYGNKDCTKEVQSKVKENSLLINVNNSIIGDPQVGSIKSLTVQYEYNGEIENITAREGEVLILPRTTSNRLGIFYTNNRIEPAVLKMSLNSIEKASKKYTTDVITSVWEHIPNNPFPEVLCNVKTGNHFNIAYQICSLLLSASLSKKYETVSFLEHDVLYGEDYFNIEPFKGNVVCNDNYIGLCKQGYQNKGQRDEPLHQLTLKFEYAYSHFRNILMESIIRGVNLEPSHSPNYDKRNSSQPSIHVNHGHHFTSHYNIYQKKYSPTEAYWGDANMLLKSMNLQ